MFGHQTGQQCDCAPKIWFECCAQIMRELGEEVQERLEREYVPAINVFDEELEYLVLVVEDVWE